MLFCPHDGNLLLVESGVSSEDVATATRGINADRCEILPTGVDHLLIQASRCSLFAVIMHEVLLSDVPLRAKHQRNNHEETAIDEKEGGRRARRRGRLEKRRPNRGTMQILRQQPSLLHADTDQVR